MPPTAISHFDRLIPAASTPGGCVILHAGDGPLPSALTAWLERRSWRGVKFDQPLSAMAALCLMDKAQSQREAWGLARVEPIGLVIIDSAHWLQLPELLAALKRHAPEAGVWLMDADAIAAVHEPRLGPAEVAPQVIGLESHDEPVAALPRPAQHVLRLAQEEPAADVPEPAPLPERESRAPPSPLRLEPPDSIDELPGEAEETPLPSVTRDELDMLLAQEST